MRNQISFIYKNIGVRISFWFVLILTVITVSSVNGVLSISAIAIHELSHLIALYFLGGRVREIRLTVKDINIAADKLCLSRWQSALVSLAGPGINIILFVVLYYFGAVDFAMTNLVIGVFNLLPITTLDGSQALGAITENHAPVLLKLLSIFCSSGVIIFGVLLLFYTKYNFSLLIVGLYLVYISAVSDT